MPFFPSKTSKARQARQAHFGRKANSCVTETTMKEMLSATCGDDTRNETPMEVSDHNNEDVVPFVDLDAYKGQDKIREKVLKTPGLLQWQHIPREVNIVHSETICKLPVAIFHFLIQ